jgi:hypothetical protein
VGVVVLAAVCADLAEGSLLPVTAPSALLRLAGLYSLPWRWPGVEKRQACAAQGREPQ